MFPIWPKSYFPSGVSDQNYNTTMTSAKIILSFQHRDTRYSSETLFVSIGLINTSNSFSSEIPKGRGTFCRSDWTKPAVCSLQVRHFKFWSQCEGDSDLLPEVTEIKALYNTEFAYRTFCFTGVSTETCVPLLEITFFITRYKKNK